MAGFRCGWQDRVELVPLGATGLAGVAVWAKGDHREKVVNAAEGQVVNVIDLQHGRTAPGAVIDIAGAFGILTVTLAAEEDRFASVRRADGTDDDLPARLVSRLRQKTSTLSQRRWYSAARAAKDISRGLVTSGSDRPSSLSNIVGSASAK